MFLKVICRRSQDWQFTVVETSWNALCVLQEIVDETDRYIDNLRLQRVNAALLTSSLPKHLRK